MIKVYFPNSNLHKVLMEIKLLEIDEELMSMSMNDAITKKLMSNNWSEDYSPGQLSPCCFVIFLIDMNKKKDKKIMCIDYPDPSKFDYNDCSNKVASWVRFING